MGEELAVKSGMKWTRRCARARGAVLECALCVTHGRGIKVKADNPDDAAYDAAARELAFEAKVGSRGREGGGQTCAGAVRVKGGDGLGGAGRRARQFYGTTHEPLRCSPALRGCAVEARLAKL